MLLHQPLVDRPRDPLQIDRVGPVVLPEDVQGVAVSVADPPLPQPDRIRAVHPLDLVGPDYAHLYLQWLQSASVSDLPRGEAEIELRDVEIHLGEAVPQHGDVEAAAIERH